jgi:predicted transcriptional regulator
MTNLHEVPGTAAWARSQMMNAISTSPINRKQWAEQAGLTYEEIKRHSRQLVQDGLVIAQSSGRTKYYSLAQPLYHSVLAS